MHRSPAIRHSSYYEEQTLGKERKIRLPPIEKPYPVKKTVKEKISRKSTIVLSKTVEITDDLEILEESIGKETLSLTSARIFINGDVILIPFSHLSKIIFAPEGEVIYNLSSSLENNNWKLGQSLYSNFEDISEDYSYPYFLPSLETSVFVLKSSAIYAKTVGNIIKILENKGLVMKINKLIQKNGPEIVMGWEGSEAKTVTKKLAENINHSYFLFLSPSELPNYLSENDQKFMKNSLIPSFPCKIQENYVKFQFPYITYSLTSEKSAVPLGLLNFIMNKTIFDNYCITN